MVIGQLGAAFAAKATAPRISLGTLFFAALVLELGAPLEDEPLLVLAAPLAVGVGYWSWTRQAEAAIVVAACVLAYALLGLCSDPVNLVVFGLGAALYLWRTQGSDLFGTLGGYFLVGLGIAVRAVHWTSGIGSATLLIALATWIDRHRERRPSMQPVARAPSPAEDPLEAETDLPAAAEAGPLPWPYL